MSIILASASPYRREQLEKIGLEFTIVPPPVDEEVLKIKYRNSKAKELCQSLAREKTHSVAKDHPDSIVIGGDQLVSFNNQTLGKPGDYDKAIIQLRKLQGQAHELVTCLCVMLGGKTHEHMNLTKMTMRPLEDKEIKKYLLKDEAWDCAGSYKIEKHGMSLFERIESDDQTAIVGIPMLALNNILLHLNYEIPAFND